MFSEDRYPTRVFWSEEDGGFIATAPDLPGCSAFGATQEEAIQELRQAIAAWVKAAQAAGNDVPEPSAVISEAAYSGRFVIRMSRRLHRLAADRAQIEGVSLNQFVVGAVAEHLGETRGREAERQAFRKTIGPALLATAKAFQAISTAASPDVLYFLRHGKTAMVEVKSSAFTTSEGKPTEGRFDYLTSSLNFNPFSTERTSKVANG